MRLTQLMMITPPGDEGEVQFGLAIVNEFNVPDNEELPDNALVSRFFREDPDVYELSYRRLGRDGTIYQSTWVLQKEPNDATGKCALCGEPYDVNDSRTSVSAVGEFVTKGDEHIIAHAECGLNAGLELA